MTDLRDRLKPIPGCYSRPRPQLPSAAVDLQDRIARQAEHLMGRGVSKKTAWAWAQAEIMQEDDDE